LISLPKKSIYIKELSKLTIVIVVLNISLYLFKNFSNIKSTNGFVFDGVDSSITLQAGNDNEILLETAGFVTIQDPTTAQDLYLNLNGVSQINITNSNNAGITINSENNINSYFKNSTLTTINNAVTIAETIGINYTNEVSFQNTSTSTYFSFANAIKDGYNFAPIDLSSPIAPNTVISSDLITLAFPPNFIILSIDSLLNGEEIGGALYSIITNWDLNRSDATNQSFYIYLGFPNGYDSNQASVSFKVNYIAFE